MNASQRIMTKMTVAAVFALSLAVTPKCLAGQSIKWDQLPEPVRAAVLANGGTEGQQVDRENGKKNGKAIYEASVKDKHGDVADVVILEDGNVIETKHDDAADSAQEWNDRLAKKFAGVKFTHPRDITNPWLPLANLKQDILEGTEDGKRVRIERTAKPDVHKTFPFGKQTVESFAVEDREWEDGQLAEVALDYFAQDDDGTVYYFGEDVDGYADGKVVSHEGSWLLGKDTKKPGIIIPGNPIVGEKFKSEDVSKDINEADEVLSLSEDVIAPAGTYQNCVKVAEHLSEGVTEHKYYAKGVGVVRELPSVGDVRLTSHTTVSSGN
jgi:hypothetical protein